MNKREYLTTDFWLAAYLKANDFKLLSVYREKGRSVFVFEDRDDRKNLINDFFNDGVIRIGAFKHAFKDMKASIYNYER